LQARPEATSGAKLVSSLSRRRSHYYIITLHYYTSPQPVLKCSARSGQFIHSPHACSRAFTGSPAVIASSCIGGVHDKKHETSTVALGHCSASRSSIPSWPLPTSGHRPHNTPSPGGCMSPGGCPNRKLSSSCAACLEIARACTVI